MTVGNAQRTVAYDEDTFPRSMRDVMGMFATGITVVTAGGDGPHGMTANAFSSVSLDPPLVLVCIARTAVMHEAILGTGSYAVSVLGGEQEHVARYFADRRRPRGMAQFDRIAWRPGPYTGAPLLDGSVAWLECELAEVYEGGDHSIFLGRVLGIGRVEDGRALLFFAGGYHRMVPANPADRRDRMSGADTPPAGHRDGPAGSAGRPGGPRPVPPA